ncbi:MAG: MBL fold metallo-hydrolase [Candidatus Thorarchaeota archaeon]
MWFSTTKLESNIFLIREPFFKISPSYLTYFTNLYLIIGPEKSLLIDTGTGIHNIANEISPIVQNREVVIFTTHRHWDHINGHHNFPDCKILLHSIDKPYLLKDELIPLDSKRKITRKALLDQQMICIDENTELNFEGLDTEIVHLPGHTGGSIALWLKNYDMIFVGDAIQTGFVYADENPNEFKQSLEKLNSLIKDQKNIKIMSSHEDLYLSVNDVEQLLIAFDESISNINYTQPIQTDTVKARMFCAGKFQILYPWKE